MAGLDFAGAGAVLEGMNEQEARQQVLYENQLALEQMNRNLDPEMRRRRIARALEKDKPLTYNEVMEKGKGPAKKAGLQETPVTAAEYAALETLPEATQTTVQPELKTTTEEKTSKNKYAGGSLPPELQPEEFGYPADMQRQRPDQTDTSYLMSRASDWISNRVVSGFDAGTTLEKEIKRMRAMSGGGLSTPGIRKEYGFDSKEAMSEFVTDVSKDWKKIHTWFRDRPDKAEVFANLSPLKKTETLKYIMGQGGGSDETTDEVQVAVGPKKAAETVKDMKAQVGLPATSAIEDTRPSKRKSMALLKDPGAPRAEAEQAQRDLEDFQQFFAEEIWRTGGGDREMMIAGMQEMQLRRSYAKESLAMQGLQDFVMRGDPTLMQAITSQQLGTPTFIQELDNGNYTMWADDQKTGERVALFENIGLDEITSTFSNANISAHKERYNKLLEKQGEIQLDVQKAIAIADAKFLQDLQLELVKGEQGVRRAQALVQARGGKLVAGTGGDYYIDVDGLHVVQLPVDTDEAGMTGYGLQYIGG